SYSASSRSVNLGTGFSAQGKLTPQGTGAGWGKDSGQASSVTQSAISGMPGNTAARTGDAETGINKIFDADRVQKEINAQTQITQLFGQQASEAIGKYANSKLQQAEQRQTEGQVKQQQAQVARNAGDNEAATTLQAQADDALAQAQTLREQWGDNGTLRLAAHTVVGALTGGAGGAAGAAAGTLTAPAVAKALQVAKVDPTLAQALTAVASTAVGAAVGGTVGGAAALNEVANNYLTSTQEIARDKELAACKNLACTVSVKLKYGGLSTLQDAGLLIGVGGGIGYQTVEQGKAIIDLVKNLPETLQALSAIVTDPEFRAKVGESVAKDYQQRIEHQTRAYNDGGWDGSITAGVEAGRLAVDIVGVATAAVGAGKVVAMTAKAGSGIITGAVQLTSTQIASSLGKFDVLVINGGLFAADGKPLMDFSKLTTQQKAVIGEALGATKFDDLVAGAQKIGRSPGVGASGIDDLYKVNKPGVDYVVVEYKFGSSVLKQTADGLQMSDEWLTGASTNYNRILESVGNPRVADDIVKAIQTNRVEKWLVHTDPFGRVTVGVLDKNGKLIPNPQMASKILGDTK
ncbi:MAG: hypothetical protein ING36_03875, partial [Burkholderiales bacterium]|nr:hypothetical protein [Burkholderiales bacterium]